MLFNWRTRILNEFTPNIARLTLVSDPNGLLFEENVLLKVRENGFEVVPYEDPISFRYIYESRFRSHWDRGESADLVAVLQAETGELNNLPFDLIKHGRKLAFSLSDIFPNLSYPVVASLNPAEFDPLYQAQCRQNPGILGENATKDFILRYVYEVAPELIKQPSDLLRFLLRRHYRNQHLPFLFDEYLIHTFRQSHLFDDWPLEKILPDREAFLAFLQERWPLFLERFISGENFGETPALYNLKYDGPVELPFGHDDVRVYVDNLFVEGLLAPVAVENGDNLAEKWVKVGVRIDPQRDRLNRLAGLLKNVQKTLPSVNTGYQEWLLFAYRWAELIYLKTEIILEGSRDLSAEIWDKIANFTSYLDETFRAWLWVRFAGLYNQPAFPPVMNHHIPRVMACERFKNPAGKAALILMDGLALDQWLVIRDVLQEQQPDYSFQEGAVFAWLPTVTPVSRQATFAGKPPLYFPDNIVSGDKEAGLWIQFWSDQGTPQNEIIYHKELGDGDLNLAEDRISNPAIHVAGFIIEKVDRIMHGMELGIAGMHNQVRQWVSQGYLARLINILLKNEFQIFLTSDHGNIEANGCGRPAEGVTVDMKGERVRIYSKPILRASMKEKFPNTIEWPATGLPEDYLPLFAPDRLAFILKGTKTVAHGGASLEELVVPYIRVSRRVS
ncbi:MAG: BREX-3 system phosphatase PglZ [Firmicutes bacterium]|nr:BREX-3 system phosphatase PglZ [Bacillota bacterium]